MSDLEDLIVELEDCAVTGTPGLSTWKRKKVRLLVAKIIEIIRKENDNE